MGLSKLLQRITVNKFWVWILLWIGLVVVLFREGMTDIASAAVGAGPLTLYYVYEEIGKQPVLSIDRGIQYQKSLFVDTKDDRHRVYPVIDVIAEVTNVGPSTARDCFCQFTVGNGTRYSGRWSGGRDTEEIDIHPGKTEQIRLLRLVPTMDSLEKINSTLGSMGTRTEVRDIFAPLEDSRNPYDSDAVEVLGFRFYVQAPLPEEAEISRLSRKGRNPQERRDFFGVHIDPDSDLSISAKFGAVDWKEKRDFSSVNIETALEKGEWDDQDPDFQKLREALNSEDWKNR